MKDGLLDRVTRLEQSLEGLSKLVAAIARTVGPDEVQAEFAAGQRYEMEQLVTKALDAGKIAPADKIGEESLVIGRETTEAGGLLPPGRFQVMFEHLVPEVGALLLGKQVGFKVKVPGGNTVEVDGIYDPAGKKVKKAKKAKAKKAKADPPALNAAVPYDPVN